MFVSPITRFLILMLTSYSLWCQELAIPFYFTPSKVAGLFHSECPPLQAVFSALLNAGYEVSSSHAVAGTIKTTAPRAAVYDVFRGWIADGRPVKMEKVKEGSPSKVLLGKPATM